MFSPSATIVTLDRNDTTTPFPPSVNFHLWRPCNMRCTFCFAGFEDSKRFLPKGHLGEEACVRINQLLAQRFDKITYVGGEPMLCPWLPRLIADAKALGATTMLVTNGSRLTEDWIDQQSGKLDWLTLSIDSAIPETHLALGRAEGRFPIPTQRYVELVRYAKARGMRIKINTVVTALNADEDMRPLIRALTPERWKIFQVLPIEGENTGSVEPLLISAEAFESYVARHQELEGEGILLAPEDNEAMTGSYAMIDPGGRFFDNTTGAFRYSSPILTVGLDEAWNQIQFDASRFEARGGNYSWGSGNLSSSGSALLGELV